jgi:hypothetical protein
VPRILDNIQSDQILLPALQDTVQVAHRADFCGDYFNPCGWRAIADHINNWSLACRFTDEESGFIINYDIKYRMGDDLFDDEGNEE